MEFLQQLLDNSSLPIVTAFLLGLITAISPCPLATNIAAIGYISKDIESQKRIFVKGLLYTLGRIIAYTVLGIILLAILKGGSSLFGIQKFIAKYGEMLIGPILLLFGLYLLFGNRLNLPSFGFKGNGEGLAKKGGWGALLLGLLFALAFCPSSAIFYFGMLIPLAASTTAGWLLTVVFAIATALPVIVVAWILAFSTNSIGRFYNKMNTIQKWFNWIVGGLFVAIGLYYCIIVFF
ncbi:MAG: sulfite exporter TauE/SafE family protein [Bacteroidales bacterium]|nr:sulfite exporter TauE/SafE family protein [Bacteroidales bacterium]